MFSLTDRVNLQQTTRTELDVSSTVAWYLADQLTVPEYMNTEIFVTMIVHTIVLTILIVVLQTGWVL